MYGLKARQSFSWLISNDFEHFETGLQDSANENIGYASIAECSKK